MLRALADLLLPERCAGCGQAGAACCRSCLAVTHARPRLARPLPSPVGLPEVWAVGEYAGPLRALLLAHKERGRHDLSAVLGGALAAAVADALPNPLAYTVADSPRRGAPGIVLVPVPSRSSAARARGYDHSTRLAKAAATRLRTRGAEVCVVPLLRLSRRVDDQGGLGAEQRLRNLEHAYVVRRRPPDGLVVIVDDVMTTGSTLTEATRALRAAGVLEVKAAVIAATRRRFARMD